MIPLVDVKAQYAPLIPDLRRCFDEVVESGQFILGPNLAAFEDEAAAYLGVPQTIGVANGTDALVLVLDGLGIGPGDEVICPAFTFYATAESIARSGATPVFAEVGAARAARRARPAADRGRGAGLRLAGHRRTRSRVDVQLLPDQESLRPGRR